MEKIANIILQTLGYFVVVISIFWIMKRVGVGFQDFSIVILAIGSTIGWGIVQLIKYFLKSNKLHK